MRVFITGATGFVGPAVTNAIAGAGHNVRVLERTPGSSGTAGLKAQTAVQGDVTDLESLRRAVRDIDVVVHLVAIRQGKKEQFERIMSDGTRHLLAAARGAGIRRFVHMSALGVSEETRDLVPYYRAKWEMEEAVRSSTVPFVIFRPSFVFGPDGGILPTFRKLAKLAPVTPIAGSGEQRLQPIWADDVAAYFVRSVDGVGTGVTFDLGGPDVVSWNELWERLKTALGVRRPSVHVPMGLMRLNALVTERLPGDIPLTRDLLKMMEAGDNIVADDAAAQAFALPLVPLDEQLRRAS